VTKNRWITGLVALLLIGGVATAAAGTDTRIGTGGATELRLPVDARSIALGGAPMANVSGVEALYFNPAGVAAMDGKTEVAFSHTSYIADIALNYVAVAQGFGDWGTLGFSAKVLSIGDMIRTTEDAPDGTGEIFTPTFSTLGLTYSRRMTDRVNFGGTVYYVAERILQETASGMAFDFGFQYQTGFNGASIGLAMKNVGGNMEFQGSDFEINLVRPGDDPTASARTLTNASAGFELPTYFQIGTNLPLMTRGVDHADAYAAFQNNSFMRDEYRAGLEWRHRKEFALRAGFAGTGDQDDLFGFSYGLGLRLPLGTAGLQLDYAGQTVSHYFDDVQTFSLRFSF
jgi:hypothetical protein